MCFINRKDLIWIKCDYLWASLEEEKIFGTLGRLEEDEERQIAEVTEPCRVENQSPDNRMGP